MEALTVNDRGFQLYYKMLKTFDPNIRSLLIFDRECELCWNSETIDSERLEKLIAYVKSAEPRQPETEGSDSNRVEIDDHVVELIRILDHGARLALIVCIESGGKLLSSKPVHQLKIAKTLNQSILEWYFASLRFARQENELELMTEELTRRYEELNLIYRAEDQAHSILHGRELLIQLVENTPGIISSDLAVLTIPGKDLTVLKFSNDEPFEKSEQMINSVNDAIFELLKTTRKSIVVNYLDDAHYSQLDYSLPFKFTASPLVNAEGEVVGVFALSRADGFEDFDNSDRNLLDVLANKASKILQYNFDPLTGLENSRSFELVLAEALKKSQPEQCAGVIAYVDIDDMAIVNDLTGREGGNLLIKDIGLTIANMVSPGDTVARLGGDKFGIYLHDCNLVAAQAIMRKIADQVQKIKFSWENKLHEVSISIGVAPMVNSSSSASSLISMAESALCSGKKIGPDRITIYRTDGNNATELKDQVQWLGRIQAALKDDDYILYCQLIEPAASETVRPHHEILLRMLGDNGEIITPGVFLPVAEKYQLMPRIDRWVISQALEMLCQHFTVSEQLDFPIAINVSGQSLSDPERLNEFLRACFQRYQVDPRAICFEITESSAIENLDSAQWFINEIKALGCEFSLDDFGTGLSSFEYLKNLDVDYLKIDGAFVHNILTDNVSESMVSAINQVGHAMGLLTIAEYVETTAIRKKLADIGVDFVQGYCIGKPVEFKKQIQASGQLNKTAPVYKAHGR